MAKAAHGGHKWQVPQSEVQEEAWSSAKSAELYGLDGWGAPYFKASAETGHLEVDPTGTVGRENSIDLYELVQDLVERGHNLPLLIRFSDILNDRSTFQL